MSQDTLYQPLDESRSEIRLLEIISGSPGAPVECKLSTVSLLETPNFAALSYVWGDPKITDDIQVDGHTLSVTVNLAAALKYVKEHWIKHVPDQDPASFRVWADAVCINQSDVSERSSQVQLMRSIYSSAKVVFSWLGCLEVEVSEIDVEVGMSIFNIIANETLDSNHLPLSSDRRDMSTNWLKNYPVLCRADPGFSVSNSAWMTVKDLMSLPYWERAWIFQEVVLAENTLVLYGSRSIQLIALYLASMWLASAEVVTQNRLHQKPDFMHENVWNSFMVDIYGWRRIHNIFMTKEALSYGRLLPAQTRWLMLGKTKDYKATDPRDYIYGFLGLANLPIIPDYHKDLRSVYQDLVRAWLEDSQCLDVLNFAGIGTFDRDPQECLPSWAPNYRYISETIPPTIDAFIGYHADRGVFYNCGDGDVPLLRDWDVVVKAALGLSVVKIHETIVLGTPDGGNIFQFAQDFVTCTPSYHGIHPLNAILQVLSRKTDYNNDEERFLHAVHFYSFLTSQGQKHFDDRSVGAELGLPADGDFREHFLGAFLPHRSNPINVGATESNIMADIKRGVMEIARHIPEISRSYRFADFECGYFGLCPKGALPGDIVCVLKDCTFPIVLRQAEDHYVHVGPCFVLGLMNGEIVTLVESARVKIKTVNIR